MTSTGGMVLALALLAVAHGVRVLFAYREAKKALAKPVPLALRGKGYRAP